jgi:hypothetical protein
MAQSCFVNHISDSVFLTRFTNALIDELSASGFDVYVDESSGEFLSLPDPKWMVEVAQLQLSENHRTDYRLVYSVETGDPFYVGTRVNQVSLSNWFGVSRANSGNKQVLFLEGYVQDDFNLGLDLDLMQGNMGLSGIRDSIGINDVYRLADEMGEKNAELLLDYFMNDYIRENLPSGIVHREYFHFNRRARSLSPDPEERFDVIVR